MVFRKTFTCVLPTIRKCFTVFLVVIFVSKLPGNFSFLSVKIANKQNRQGKHFFNFQRSHDRFEKVIFSRELIQFTGNFQRSGVKKKKEKKTGGLNSNAVRRVIPSNNVNRASESLKTFLFSWSWFFRQDVCLLFGKIIHTKVDSSNMNWSDRGRIS